MKDADTPDSTDASSSDRLHDLVESYFASCRRGQAPDLELFAAEHPEIADKIRDLFPALALLEAAKPGELSGGARASLGEGPTRDLQPPRRLGEYVLIQEIGRGGMGIVYEAEQESLGRRVAIKVLDSHGLFEASGLERFRREAQALSRLQHPHLVSVFAIGEDQGVHFFVMELIRGSGLDKVVGEVRRLRSSGGKTTPPSSDGKSNDLSTTVALRLLSDGMARAPLEMALEEAKTPDSLPGPYFISCARIVEQAALALAYAHGQGILHRDVKPSNILVDEQGSGWLTDFGLAKADGLENVTRSGEVVGTLRYLAPERFRGVTDARADVYGLGMTLYELLTLAPPFPTTDRYELIEKVLHGEPVPPRQVQPGIPRDLEAIVLKAIRKDAAMRYQSSSEMVRDLELFLAGKTVPRDLLGVGRRRRRPIGARVVVAAASILFVALLAFTAAHFWWLSLPQAIVRSFPAGDGPVCVLARDFDANGNVELAVADVLGGEVRLLGRSGRDDWETRGHVSVGLQPLFLAASDLDGDGDLDLAVTNHGEKSVSVLRNGGNSDFQEAGRLAVDDQPFFIAAADLDGDHDSDLAVTGGEKSIWIFRNGGSADFTLALKLESTPRPNGIVAEDFDRDGILDLAVGNGPASSVSMFRGSAGLTFSAPRVFPAGQYAFQLVVADFDGDGDLDLAGTGWNLSVMFVLSNLGGGDFSKLTSIHLTSDAISLAAGDLDGDGRIDLAATGGEKSLWLILNTGDGHFAPAIEVVAGEKPNHLSLGDIDGDGRQDAVVTSFGSSSICVLSGVARWLQAGQR